MSSSGRSSSATPGPAHFSRQFRTVLGFVGAGVIAACAEDEMLADLAHTERCRGACEITYDTIAVLGARADTLSPAYGAVAVRDASGAFYVAPTDHPGVVAIYSASGQILRTFGRPGEGPGEFDTEMLRFLRGRGDTISLIEFFRGRRTLVNGTGDLYRTHRLPAMSYGVVELGEQVIVQADIRTPDKIGKLLHAVTAEGEAGVSYVENPVYRNETDGFRPIARAIDGGVWVARRTEYRIDHHDSTIAFNKAIQPTAKWFQPHGGGENPFSERPEPAIAGLWQSPDSLLWVSITVADRKWRPRPVRRGGVSLETALVLRDWILEVIDPATGRRLATRRHDGPLIFGNGDGLVYESSVGQLGQTVLTALAPHLSQHGERR